MKKKLLAASMLLGSLLGGTMMAVPATATPPSCSGFDSLNNGVSGVMSCVVPAGMTQMQVIATGAGGGGGGGIRTSTGGNGAIVTSVISVTPGETITLEVGTGGGGNSPSNPAGGGGGGYTAVLRGSTALVIAGGGGGGGSADNGTGVPAGTAFAGGNGGQSGSNGAPATVYNQPGDNAYSGSGATQSAGGSGGSASSQSGNSGTASNGGSGGDACSMGGSGGGTGWQGGASVNNCITGGGGGAGYFGGGGGGAVYGGGAAAGSGGGGSSYVLLGTNTTFTIATNGGLNHAAGGNGHIDLSLYTPPAPSGPSTLTLTPGFVVGDLAPSAPVTLSGTDLQPSSNWSADIHSTVVQFANGVTDSSGNFSLGSNLPSSVDPGRHVITLYGIANDGSQWTRVLYITVGANLRVTYMSTTGEELASTGANVLPVVSIASSLVLAGVILLVVRSRRRPTENS